MVEGGATPAPTPSGRRTAAMDEVKATLADLRGEGETVTCARCGKEVAVADAEPEEGGEWECLPCWERCEAQERQDDTDTLPVHLRDPFAVIERGNFLLANGIPLKRPTVKNVRLRPMALHYENVYRAHVAPPVGPEWTCFVEASSREAAWQKIRSLTSDEHDVYNVHSALKLIAEGESEDPELRLFEVGWGGDLPPRFCEHPVFFVRNPGDWARKWAAAIVLEELARLVFEGPGVEPAGFEEPGDCSEQEQKMRGYA